MPLTEEEISQIAIRTAEEVMKRRGDICKCVDWFLVATTAAEALEHNATVSNMAKDLHEELKVVIPQKQLEDLEFKHVLLQGYITEGMAELALSGSLGSIRDKCNVDISDVKKVADSGFEAIKKRDPIMAAQNFSKLKGELVRLADNICGRKEGNPGAKEPWQMTKEEFAIIYLEKRRDYLGKVAYSQLTQEELQKEREEAIDYQKHTIVQALRAGKPVPPEVLADYPDLRTKEGNPDTGTSIIDLRGDYDEIAHVKDGILYRKGNIVQVWWDIWGKETWTGPSEEQARENFNAMKERWSSSELKGDNPIEGKPVRVRFDRADIDSAITAAKRLESEKDLYIFATYLGYTIDYRPPPGMQAYVIVHPDGTTETIKPGG